MYQVILHVPYDEDAEYPSDHPAHWDWTTLIDSVEPVVCKEAVKVDRDPDVHFDDLLFLTEYIRNEIDDLVAMNESEFATVQDASQAADNLHAMLQELEKLNERYL